MDSTPNSITPGNRPNSRTPRVLLVEDVPTVRRLAAIVIKHCGCEVVPASGARVAFRHWNAAPDDFDLVVCDVHLDKDMSGPALVVALREMRPRLPVIFTSGASLSTLAHVPPQDEQTYWLQKPYGMDLIRRTIFAAVAVNAMAAAGEKVA